MIGTESGKGDIGKHVDARGVQPGSADEATSTQCRAVIREVVENEMAEFGRESWIRAKTDVLCGAGNVLPSLPWMNEELVDIVADKMAGRNEWRVPSSFPCLQLKELTVCEDEGAPQR